MADRMTTWIAIVAIAVGTLAARGSFLLLADRGEHVNPDLARVLRMIPPAALAALVAHQLADPHASTALVARLVASAAAGYIGWRRWNLAIAIVVGMAVVMALDAVL